MEPAERLSVDEDRALSSLRARARLDFRRLPNLACWVSFACRLRGGVVREVAAGDVEAPTTLRRRFGLDPVAADCSDDGPRLASEQRSS